MINEYPGSVAQLMKPQLKDHAMGNEAVQGGGRKATAGLPAAHEGQLTVLGLAALQRPAGCRPATGWLWPR
jgi:hypothetical protein